jgi:nucleoid DNA-binding protein
MTKAELIEKIARSRELPPDVTKKCIGQILELAFEELGAYFVRARVTRTQCPRFTFPGFGTFTKKKRSARKGINPRTLEPMTIDAAYTIDFRPGPSCEEPELRGSPLPAPARPGDAPQRSPTSVTTASASRSCRRSRRSRTSTVRMTASRSSGVASPTATTSTSTRPTGTTSKTTLLKCLLKWPAKWSSPRPRSRPTAGQVRPAGRADAARPGPRRRVDPHGLLSARETRTQPETCTQPTTRPGPQGGPGRSRNTGATSRPC